MRLIDADEIIKWADDSVSQYGGTYSIDMLNMFGLFKEVIDNTPTVEPKTKVVANVTFDKEQMEELVEKAKADILAQIEIERPQGEWVYSQYDANPNIGNWHCSKCRHIEIGGYNQKPNVNFCPNCGAKMIADMRKGGAE